MIMTVCVSCCCVYCVGTRNYALKIEQSTKDRLFFFFYVLPAAVAYYYEAGVEGGHRNVSDTRDIF